MLYVSYLEIEDVASPPAVAESEIFDFLGSGSVANIQPWACEVQNVQQPGWSNFGNGYGVVVRMAQSVVVCALDKPELYNLSYFLRCSMSAQLD